jgi:hypothetical protein
MEPAADTGKVNYKIHKDSIKDNIISTPITKEQASFIIPMKRYAKYGVIRKIGAEVAK